MEAREGAAAEAANAAAAAAMAKTRLLKKKTEKVILHLIATIENHFNRALQNFLKMKILE